MAYGDAASAGAQAAECEAAVAKFGLVTPQNRAFARRPVSRVVREGERQEQNRAERQDGDNEAAI